MNYNVIVATCSNNGIGKDNELPWNIISEDMKMFSKLTKGNGNNAIIMGKNTYNSIGKALPARTNIVLSTSLCQSDFNNITIMSNIDNCIKFCNNKKFDEVWIIGGETVYKDFLKLNIINFIYETKIYSNYDCDTYFPNIPIKYNIKSVEKLRNENPNTILVVWEINPIPNNGVMRHNNSFP